MFYSVFHSSKFSTSTLECSMLQNHPSYDSEALRLRLVQRHGADLGAIVYDAEVNRRCAQDARAVELNNELRALHAEISTLRHAAGERRTKSRETLEAAYAEYRTLCSEEAKIDSIEQAVFASKSALSLEMQKQLRDITLPRITEREMLDFARRTSANAELLRSFDKKLPPLEAPPLSVLAKINLALRFKTSES
jgi:hypothetical protein